MVKDLQDVGKKAIQKSTSWSVTQKTGKVVPVVQAYLFTKYLGRLTVNFDTETGDLLKPVQGVGVESADMRRHLSRAANVRTRVIGEYDYGWMRLSTHIYNSPDQIEPRMTDISLEIGLLNASFDSDPVTRASSSRSTKL